MYPLTPVRTERPIRNTNFTLFISGLFLPPFPAAGISPLSGQTKKDIHL